MTPALALAAWLALFVATGLHAVQGGPARRWLIGLAAAPAGLAAGELLARLSGCVAGVAGGVHVPHAALAATLAAWAARRWLGSAGPR